MRHEKITTQQGFAKVHRVYCGISGNFFCIFNLNDFAMLKTIINIIFKQQQFT